MNDEYLCWFCGDKLSNPTQTDKFLSQYRSLLDCVDCGVQISFYNDNSNIEIQFDSFYLASFITQDESYSLIVEPRNRINTQCELLDFTSYASLEDLESKILGYLALL